jgi:Dolichyl-phosphate-mannose-protein mannosyltransferase
VLIAAGPRLAGAHAYGTAPPNGTPEGLDILYAGGHYWRTLTLARLGALPFLALLLLGTWLWARRLLASEPAALLAVLLLASVPAVLGHGALASLDVAAAATMVLALYALQNWLASGTLRAASAFGLAAGVAVATKFSAVPFVGVALPALALCGALLRAFPARPGASGPPAGAERVPAGRRAAGLVLAAAAALVVLFLVYAPRVSDPAGVAFRYHWALSYLLLRPGLDHQLGVLLGHVWLPREFKDLLNGIVAVKAHNDSGHRSFLLGEVRWSGWWYFYLVALAAKTPLPLLLAGPPGLILLARAGWRTRDAWQLAPALIVLAILLFASSFSHINIGIRHILVLYPFLVLGAAYLLQRSWRALRRIRDARLAAASGAAILVLCLWQLSTLWRAYPDYLPYFNEAVAHPERVLVDSDLDWGQDLYRLERRTAQLHIPRLSIAYRGTANLAREPLPPLTILPPHQPARGWVAISLLARTRNASDYAWLSAYVPVERVGKSIDLYFIP